MRLRSKAVVWIAFLSGVTGLLQARAGQAGALASTEQRTPIELVNEAFDRMFNYPAVRTVRLLIRRNGRLKSQRTFDIVYRRLEGQGHSLLRFTSPEYLRGTSLLIIEQGNGTSDAWLYRPEDRRPRRVGTHQKGDAFYGSDITFEDLEHHAWERFTLTQLDDLIEERIAFHVIEVVPPTDSQYSKLIIRIEKRRMALSRIDFYRGRRYEPLKTLVVPLDEIVEEDGVLKPARLFIHQHGRDASTELEVTRLEIDPAITERVFSAMRLERDNEDLFDLIKRTRTNEDPQEGAADR